MKRLLFCFLLALTLLENCKPDEDSSPKYTFKGQFINATENKVPVGLKVTLEASSGPNSFDYKTEILGTAITDSFDRFSITYLRTKLYILRLLSQFYTYSKFAH